MASEPHPHQIVGFSAQSALAPEERGALESARALVDEQLERDARVVSVDLYDLLSKKSAQPYAQGGAHEVLSDDPLRRPLFAPVNDRPFVKLPGALEQAMAGVQYEMFAGLFPEIHRAWLTVDHRFFMWDFEDPLGGFVQHDGLDQSIVSAALARPPAGAFPDDVPYVVLLATPVEVTVLCVRMGGGGGGGGGGDSALELYHSGLRVLTDNVNMVKMVGTPTGRVFMGGADGFLYELMLRGAEGSWWAPRAAKRPRSRRLERVRHFVFSALFESHDPIIDLVVDAERGVLVTLSRASVLQLYSLGEGGEDTAWLCSKSADALRAELSQLQQSCVRRGTIDLLARDIDAAAKAAPTAPVAALVGMSAVPTAVSRVVQLVVTSASGVRLYLSYGQGGSSRSQQLHTLRAYAALDPPPSAGFGAAGADSADARAAGFGGMGGALGGGYGGGAAGWGELGGLGLGRAELGGGGGGGDKLHVPLDGALFASGCYLLVDEPKGELVCLAPVPSAVSRAGGGGGASCLGLGGGAFGSAASVGGTPGGAGGLGSPAPGGAYAAAYARPSAAAFADAVGYDELCESVTRLRVPAAVYALCELPCADATSPFALPASAAAGGGGGLGGARAAAPGATPDALARLGGAALASASNVAALADARGALGEIVSQLLTAPRRFAVLTAGGVYTFEKRRPIELMASALGDAASEHLQRELALHSLFARFGAAEACAMSLAIGALRPRSAVAAAPPGALSGSAISAWARQLGGEAHRDAGNLALHGGTAFGQAIEPDAVRFSGRHGGLLAIAARLLAAVWAQPITATDETGVRVARSREHWASLADALRRVCAFVREHAEQWGVRAPPAAAAAHGSALQRRALSPDQVRSAIGQQMVEKEERASLEALWRLLDRAAQAASAVALLAETSTAAAWAAGAPPASASARAPPAQSWSADAPARQPFAFLQRLAARLPDAEQAMLASLTFADLVAARARAAPGASATPTSAGGGGGGGAAGGGAAGWDPALSEKLPRALLLELLRDHAGDGALVARLQRECPAYFSAADHAIYRVWTDLASATASTAPPAERARALRGALRTCADYALAIDLRAVVSLFVELGLYEAIIDLPCARAALLDPNHAARAAAIPGGGGGGALGGGGGGASPAAWRALQERLSAYRVCVDALQGLLSAGSHATPPAAAARPAPAAAPARVAPDMWKRVLDYGLQRRPLDEALHIGLFWWVLAAGQGAVLPALDSPVLERFLSTAADEGPDAIARTWGPMLRAAGAAADVPSLCNKLAHREPLATFYVRRAWHVEAARAFAALAEREGSAADAGRPQPPPTLAQREAWLVQALLAARAASESGGSLGPDFVRIAEERLSVVRAQSKVLTQLEQVARTNPGVHGLTLELGQRLFELDALYGLCEQHQLHLAALAVLGVAAPYQQYADHVEKHLLALLERSMDGGWASTCEAVRELRAAFCAPHPAEPYVLRLDLICATLEAERLQSADGSSAHVVQLLSTGVEPPVPWERLWKTYADPSARGSRMQALWEQSGSARLHLLGAVHELVTGWIHAHAAAPSLSARQAVCSAVDGFIVDLNTRSEPAAAQLRDAYKGLRIELAPPAAAATL